MRAVLEKDVEHAIGQWLKVHGFMFWKNPSSGYFDARKCAFRKHQSPWVRNGAPDFIVVHQGLFIGIECKSSRGYLSGVQKSFMDDVRKAGGRFIVARSIDDVEQAFHDFGVLPKR